MIINHLILDVFSLKVDASPRVFLVEVQFGRGGASQREPWGVVLLVGVGELQLSTQLQPDGLAGGAFLVLPPALGDHGLGTLGVTMGHKEFRPARDNSQHKS